MRRVPVHEPPHTDWTLESDTEAISGDVRVDNPVSDFRPKGVRPCQDQGVSDNYRVEVWKRGFTAPLTVVLAGRIGKEDAEQRFQQLCDVVSARRATGEPLTYITWTDVVNGHGVVIEPAATVKIVLKGPDLDLAEEFN